MPPRPPGTRCLRQRGDRAMIRFRWSASEKQEFLDTGKLLLATSYVITLSIIMIITILVFFVGTFRVNKWLIRIVRWSFLSTKINYMQSIFQLGAATSIAFAIAGPQIQHALGPRTQGALRHAKLAINKPTGLTSKSRKLISILHNYDRYQREYSALGRGNLYILHCSMALINFTLLLWFSLIDPRGQIPNGIAALIIMFSMFVPLVDLSRTFTDARHIRPMLQEARKACDSGMPDRIDAISARLEAEIKPLPPNM